MPKKLSILDILENHILDKYASRKLFFKVVLNEEFKNKKSGQGTNFDPNERLHTSLELQAIYGKQPEKA